jgi:F-type H+-transporting ATPase subunit alpha
MSTSSIRPEEVTSILEKELSSYGKELQEVGVGTVLQVGDGIARLYGLQDVMAGELIEFQNGVFGMVLNLEEDNVGCIVLGSDVEIREGDTAKRTGRIASVPAGDALVGRVVNALGQPGRQGSHCYGQAPLHRDPRPRRGRPPAG